VIWAILALLGVPLWLIAIGIASIVYRNRALHARENNIAVRLRRVGEKRWKRGNAVWTHDVFCFRGLPAAWSEALLWVCTASTNDPAGDDIHKLRRMKEPSIALFTCPDGETVEVAANGADRRLLLGPLAETVAPHPA
jgi:hypothetical protein